MDTLCHCCDTPIDKDETYIGVPEPAYTSLDHYICYDCARRYLWHYLEDPNGLVLINYKYPAIYWDW